MEKSNEILEFLQSYHNAECKAVGAGELATLFNTNKRGLRLIVTALRKEGKPICSSNYGYWYSDEAEDIDKTIARLEAQADNMIKAVAGLRKAKNRG